MITIKSWIERNTSDYSIILHGGAVAAAWASTARELTWYKYLPTNLFVGYGYEDSLATRHNYLFRRTLSGLPNTFSESLLFGHASTSFTTVRDTCGAVSLRPKLQAVAWWCLLCLLVALDTARPEWDPAELDSAHHGWHRLALLCCLLAASVGIVLLPPCFALRGPRRLLPALFLKYKWLQYYFAWIIIF